MKAKDIILETNDAFRYRLFGWCTKYDEISGDGMADVYRYSIRDAKDLVRERIRPLLLPHSSEEEDLADEFVSTFPDYQGYADKGLWVMLEDAYGCPETGSYDLAAYTFAEDLIKSGLAKKVGHGEFYYDADYYMKDFEPLTPVHVKPNIE